MTPKWRGYLLGIESGTGHLIAVRGSFDGTYVIVNGY